MSDKVISLFKRQKGGQFPKELEETGEVTTTPDGYTYVSVKVQDEEGYREDELIDRAGRRHYMVKMLEHHKGNVRVNHYHVTGEKLESFLKNLENRPGRLLEIEHFYPEGTA